jgi:hypothetical protein
MLSEYVRNSIDGQEVQPRVVLLRKCVAPLRTVRSSSQQDLHRELLSVLGLLADLRPSIESMRMIRWYQLDLDVLRQEQSMI